MWRKLAPIITVNVLLGLTFILSNYDLWDFAQSSTGLVQLVQFDPFWIRTIQLGALVNGQIMPVNAVTAPYFNLPFWTFFVTIAVNMFFIYRLQRSKETKQSPSQNST